MRRLSSLYNYAKAAIRPAGQGGFGLLELLIALTILAIGTLGILKLQMQSGLGNADSRFQSAATNLGRSKMEELKRLAAYTYQETPIADLEDKAPVGVLAHLDDWASPDHSIGPLSETMDGSGAKLYTVSWNVVDNHPITDFKTVRLRVSWTQGKRDRYVEMEAQIGRKDVEYFQ